MGKFSDLGNKVIPYAKELGAEEAEAYFSVSKSSLIKCSGRDVRVKSGTTAGVGIRTLIHKSMGFSATSSMDENEIFYAVKKSVGLARIKAPDPYWLSLPDPQKPLGNKGIFDKRIVKIDPSSMFASLLDTIRNITDCDGRVSHVTAEIKTESHNVGIVNTNGVDVADEGTFMRASFLVNAKDGNEEETGSDYTVSRRFIMNLDGIAHNAVERAISSFKGTKLKETRCPVVFANTCVAWFLLGMFVPNILAINFHKHTSAYEGKINQLVTSTNINLIDDGTYEDGIHTSLFDAEGVPRRRTPIIERGMLRTPLYDNCSSKRYDVESTGNASRGGYGLPDFATPPFIQPSNLVMEPSDESNGDLLQFVGSGVLFTGVLTGMGHSNFTTGEFIITSSNAFQIKNGELRKSLKPCSCRGNFHTMIKNITAVGKDMKNFGMVICPSIAVKELSLST